MKSEKNTDKSYLDAGRVAGKHRFDSIIAIAQRIADINPHALLDFVRLVGRKVQSEFMSKAIYDGVDGENLLWAEPGELWWGQSEMFCDFKKQVAPARLIWLKHDLILPWPWKAHRIIKNLCSIGPHRVEGTWQERYNHRVEMWLPWEIVWVHSGNHSIVVGITQGEGTIQNYNAFDLSQVFDFAYSDGLNFYRIEKNSILAPVTNVEFAAIFEIGRIFLRSQKKFAKNVCVKS